MALVLLLLSILPSNRVVTDTYDMVEVNHLYDDQARLVFSQVIWWDFFPGENDFHVQDWRFIKNPTILPRAKGCRYESFFYDYKTPKVWRRVWASQHKETWTQYDPERHDLVDYPQNFRKKLRIPNRR